MLHLHSGNLYGGVETFLVTMAREAAAAPALTSRFALCFDGRLAQELRTSGASPDRLGSVRLSRPWEVRRARRALADVLRARSCDVVVCHQAWTFVLFARQVRKAGIPVVLWLHTSLTGTHWLDVAARRAGPEAVIANSRFTAALAMRWLPHARVARVRYAVSRASESGAPGIRPRLRASLGAGPDEVVVLHASRLEPLKGHRVLLDALARVDGPWTCWIAGGVQRRSERAYRRAIERLAVARGLASRVHFLGERDDVPGLMAAADLYCQPNVRPEAFGLTFVEALRAGLPVVTSDIGGAREIVADDAGLRVPADDVPALAQALQSLIADGSRRARLAAGARRAATDLCDPSVELPRIHEALHAVTTASSTTPRPAVCGVELS